MERTPAPRTSLPPLLQHHTATWNLSPPQRDALALFCEELLRWAPAADLTGFRNEQDVVTEGIVPSLAYLDGCDAEKGLALLDVGSGAGLPGLVLKVARPDLMVTLLEPSRKKVSFLKHITRTLGLSGVQVLRGRAEEVARDGRHRQAYNIVTSRALAKPPEALPLCLPFVKPGGRLILLSTGEGAGGLPPEKVSVREISVAGMTARLLVYTLQS